MNEEQYHILIGESSALYLKAFSNMLAKDHTVDFAKCLPDFLRAAKNPYDLYIISCKITSAPINVAGTVRRLHPNNPVLLALDEEVKDLPVNVYQMKLHPRDFANLEVRVQCILKNQVRP